MIMEFWLLLRNQIDIGEGKTFCLFSYASSFVKKAENKPKLSFCLSFIFGLGDFSKMFTFLRGRGGSI